MFGLYHQCLDVSIGQTLKIVVGSIRSCFAAGAFATKMATAKYEIERRCGAAGCCNENDALPIITAVYEPGRCAICLLHGAYYAF